MISPILETSYNNIMYQQEKMDNKAYVFIGIIGFIFTILFSAEKDSLIFNYINEDFFCMVFIFLVSILTPLVFSLIPIATKFLIYFMNKFNECFFKKSGKNKEDFNVFYYIYFYNFESKEFIDLFKSNYDIDELSKPDVFLVEQIIINARILNVKILFHTLSQFITISVIFYFLFLFIF